MPPTMHRRVFWAREPTTRPATRDRAMGACMEPGPSVLNRMKEGAATSSTRNTTWTTEIIPPSSGLCS